MDLDPPWFGLALLGRLGPGESEGECEVEWLLRLPRLVRLDLLPLRLRLLLWRRHGVSGKGRGRQKRAYTHLYNTSEYRRRRRRRRRKEEQEEKEEEKKEEEK